MSKLEKLVDAIRELATNYPNNVYLSKDGPGFCSYVTGQCTEYGTGCIVGQALIESGLSDYDTLDWNDGPSAPGLLSDCLEWAITDEKLIDWVTVVQEQQDQGATWKDAITAADEYVRETHE